MQQSVVTELERHHPPHPVPPVSYTPVEQGDPGLRDVLSVVARRKGVLFATIVPALLLAIAFVNLVTPRYSAETLILIEPQSPNFGSLDAVVAGLSGDEESVQSEAYVLSSRALAGRVIQQLALGEDPEFNDVAGAGHESGAPAIGTQEYGALVDRFLERLTVAPHENSRVIAVSFASEQPEKAAEIVNVLADEYLLARLEAKFESTQRASAWLGARVAELRDDVERAETAVEAARQQYGLIEGKGITLASQELVELNTQLILARSVRAEANAKLQQVQRLRNSTGGASTASDVLDSPLIQRLREQQVQVERRVAELSSEYGELHPRMIQLRAEAQDIDQRIDAEVNKILAGLRNDYNIARARERSLQQSLDELKDTVAQANQNEVELRALEREAEASRGLLATMLARQKETMSQEDLEFQQPDARIISAADVPVEPSFPNVPMVFSLALIGGGFLGLIIMLLRELLDGGFRSGEQMEAVTGVPSIGFVPRVSSTGDYQTLAGYVAGRPSSALGEAIRTLGWSLQITFPDQAPRSVLITSSVPSEGKTTIAACLATMHSGEGRRVVLVDADTRNPGCHSLTGNDREPGLVDVLLDQARLEDVMVTSSWSGLSLIPAGMPTPNAPNLLGSRKMEMLLQELAERFDHVIIDSPPVMAAADARILCRLAEATVMVVRWGGTRRETVRLAMKQLDTAGARLAGGLLSMVDVKKNAQYSYGDSGAYAGELEKYYAG